MQNPVAWVALLVSILALSVTVYRFRRDFERNNSHDYLTAATRCLEQAYEAFDKARTSTWNDLPKPSRTLWLAVARLIKDSEATSKLITEKSHRILYEHACAFWRGKFYDLLDPLGTISLKYFASDADSILGTAGDTRLPISDKAIRVILEFVQWPENKEDPMKDIKRYKESEIQKIRAFRYKAVGDYLDAQNAMWSGDEHQKTFWREKWHEAIEPEQQKPTDS